MRGIYCITNLVNEKKYIGQSCDVKRRIRRHRFDLNHQKHINDHLQNAWDKYGKENFLFEIIAVCESIEELNSLEIDLIKKFDCFKSGYNRTHGGESGYTSFLGRKHSPESILKMRNSTLGTFPSEETRAKMRASSKGFRGNHTEEAKRKMSKKAKGRTFSESTRKKISDAHFGKKLSEETKKKMGEARKGTKLSEEVKKKISETKRFKLTEAQEEDIKSRISNGESFRKIAKDYECSYMTLIRRFKNKEEF